MAEDEYTPGPAEQKFIDERPLNYDNDDMQTVAVGRDVPGQWTDKQVRYSLLWDPSDGEVLGALWVGEQDDTAGFYRRHDAGERAEEADLEWTLRIAQAQQHSNWSARGFYEYWLDAPTGAYILTPQPQPRRGSDSLQSVLT